MSVFQVFVKLRDEQLDGADRNLGSYLLGVFDGVVLVVLRISESQVTWAASGSDWNQLQSSLDPNPEQHIIHNPLPMYSHSGKGN